MKSIYPHLTEKMEENHISASDLAILLHVTEKVMLDKIAGVLPFYLHEAVQICCFFGISDAAYLFFQLHVK